MTFDPRKCPICGADFQGVHTCSESFYGEPAECDHDDVEDERCLCCGKFLGAEEPFEEDT